MLCRRVLHRMIDTTSKNSADSAAVKAQNCSKGALCMVERITEVFYEWELTVMLWLREWHAANVLPALVCGPFLAYHGVRWV